MVYENTKLIEKISNLKSPYDHQHLVSDYKRTHDRNERLRYTMPVDDYMHRIYSPQKGRPGESLSASLASGRSLGPPADCRRGTRKAALSGAAIPSPPPGQDPRPIRWRPSWSTCRSTSGPPRHHLRDWSC